MESKAIYYSIFYVHVRVLHWLASLITEPWTYITPKLACVLYSSWWNIKDNYPPRAQGKHLHHGPTSRRNWLVSYIPLGGTSKIITLHEPKESTSTSADMTDQLFSAVGTSLRKQPPFRDVTTGFPGKWRLRNERKNSILMTGHYPDLASASDWWKFASSNQKHYPDLGSASDWWKFASSNQKHYPDLGSDA